ncbi:condensation domain-containing protein, partial [Actinoplanes couchii]
RRLAALSREPVDLTGRAPMRARLVGTGTVLVTAHHLAVDEWSVVPLIDDLSRAYAARSAGRAPEWVALPVDYADYTRWAYEVLGDPADPASTHARQLDRWRSALAGLPDRIDLPGARRPVAAASTGRSELVPVVLDAGTHAAVDELARRTGTSMFMVFHAALAALLTGAGAGTDLPIGALMAGRSEPALADLVGTFFNTVVLRTDTSGDPSFGELLGRVREIDLGALDLQDLPFDVLEIAPQVMIVHHEEARLADVGGPGVRLETPATGALRAELTLSFYEPADGRPVHCDLEYAADLFDRAAVAELGERFRRLLTAAVAHPDRPLSRLVDDAERTI